MLPTAHSDLTEVLKCYRRRQFREHLVGPLISFVAHLVVLALMSVLIVSPSREPVKTWTVTAYLPQHYIDLPPPVDHTSDTDHEPTFTAPPTVPPSPRISGPTVIADGDLDDPSPIPTILDDSLDTIDRTTPATPVIVCSLPTVRQRQQRLRDATPRVQKSVLDALRWLQRTQREDGSWETQPAFSGLALLCFLGHGETPLSEEFGLTVQRAMQWLTPQLPLDRYRGYGNGIATYAVAEGYAMTRIPMLRAAMERGLSVIVKGQQPGGGFDYSYKQGVRWDVSICGWQIQAMKAGYIAGADVAGLDEALSESVRFLRKTAYRDGQFGYSTPGSGGNMTGIGTVCLQLLGAGESREARQGAATILNDRLETYTWESADSCLYGWYYDTQAMFNTGGRAWKRWERQFSRELIDNQHADGYWEIERDTHGYGSSLAGRVYVTTLVVLQLEVGIRYLPTYDHHNFTQTADRGSILDE